MKETKSKKVFLAVAVLLSGIITIGSFSIAETGPETQGISKASYPMFKYLNGTIEFNLVPPGDNRVWHIVNKFNVLDPGEGQGCNMAEYIFTSDSVFVVNKYAGVPSQALRGINLAHVFLNQINPNN